MLIPQIQSITQHDRTTFSLSEGAEVSLYTAEEQKRLEELATLIFPNRPIRTSTGKAAAGYSLHAGGGNPVIDEPKKARALQHREGYYLKLSGDSAVLHASHAAGLFYGLQTLRQLLDSHEAVPETEIADWPHLEFRCANYDFRLLYPKFEKLIEYIETMASFKYNALLIEYEDKLPFKKHEHLRHDRFAFTDEQLQLLQETAKRNFIEIIPLQQTFGHLEYVLKHDAHKALKESREAIGELCPSNPGSLELATGLIDEMIAAHPDSRYLHLGCDEVWCLCLCDRCRKSFADSRPEAFITYVNKLIDFTAARGKIPIIWHDMLASCTNDELSRLDHRAVVMIWRYDGKNIEETVADFTNRCRAQGISVLGGPSIRAWDRTDDQPHPVAENRIRNIEQWTRAANRLKLPGAVATNWGTVFGMGVPYGIFETTWFLMGYAADKFWNAESDSRDYLSRFLSIFHGIEPADVLEKIGNHDPADYYEWIGKFVDQVTKNRDIAEHIRLIKLHETAVSKSRTLHKYYYRSTLFDNESERISLDLKHKATRRLLNQVRPELETNLKHFMPDEMVDHFMKSRFYLHDWLEENLYQKAPFARETDW